MNYSSLKKVDDILNLVVNPNKYIDNGEAVFKLQGDPLNYLNCKVLKPI